MSLWYGSYNICVFIHWLLCSGCTDGDVRLTGGSSMTEGTVEVCHNQTWGMVSGLGWGEEDARVICRQLHLQVDGVW